MISVSASTKIARLWFLDVDSSLQCAVLSASELEKVLEISAYHCEVVAIQHYLPENPLNGSGIYESYSYLYKGSRYVESCELNMRGNFGLQPTIYVASSFERMPLPSEYHELLSSVSKEIVKYIEACSKCWVNSVILEYSFTTTGVPILVAAKSIVLSHLSRLAMEDKDNFVYFTSQCNFDAPTNDSLRNALPNAKFSCVRKMISSTSDAVRTTLSSVHSDLLDVLDVLVPQENNLRSPQKHGDRWMTLTSPMKARQRIEELSSNEANKYERNAHDIDVTTNNTVQFPIRTHYLRTSKNSSLTNLRPFARPDPGPNYQMLTECQRNRNDSTVKLLKPLPSETTFKRPQSAPIRR